jgi:hypothetical protein
MDEQPRETALQRRLREHVTQGTLSTPSQRAAIRRAYWRTGVQPGSWIDRALRHTLPPGGAK